jgi:phosphatidylserine/phosphatidylglycerophosphate/cardiolipin synthase-like enzyme
VEVSEQARLLHHKFAVIDGRYVVTGSYNWTESAERRNRENLVILDCPEVAQAFSAAWESIRKHSLEEKRCSYVETCFSFDGIW